MRGNKLRVALAVSGGGTTMNQILQATKDSRLPYVEPACVIASTDGIGAIMKAEAHGLEMGRDIFVVKKSEFSSPEAYGEELLRITRRCGADFWGQYGWIPRTPANLIEAFAGMAVNQHAGPIRPGRPDFGKLHGRQTHCARLAFVREMQRNFWTEAVAQRVTVEFDEGAVLDYARSSIEIKTDDPETLAARLLPFEHEVQIRTLRAFSENRVQEIKFDDDLVLPHEAALLDQIKRCARHIFPKG